MGFCKRCGDLVHGTNCLKCGGRAVSSATSGLPATGTRNDPWMNMYQNILEGGGSMSRTSKRMSLPVISTSNTITTTVAPKPQPLITQKLCNGCNKQILQAKVFAEPSRPTVIYCEKCYVERFTKGNCPTCYKPVMSKTDIFVTYENRSWHKNCFMCFNCRKDVSSRPMVDLRKRPCCENCLMAQAGSSQSPLSDRSTDALHSASAISPGTSIPSSPSPISTTSSSRLVHPSTSTFTPTHAPFSADVHRLHQHLSPLDMNANSHGTTELTRQASPAPLSHSSSTSSNYRQDFSSATGNTTPAYVHDYVGSVSPTYPSSVRRQTEDFANGSTSTSVKMGNTSASPFVRDEVYPPLSVGSGGGGSNGGWRSNSSLSNHSQHNSRASSPFPSHPYGHGSDHLRPVSPIGRDVSHPGLYRTRSRSFGGHGSALNSRSSSPGSVRSSVTSSSSGLYRSDSQVTTATNASSSDDAATANNGHSRPTTPLLHKTALLDSEPTTIEDREQPLHPKPEDPKLTRNAYKEQQVPPPPTSRHGLHRMRSRSFAATTEKPGLVRARTEALMAASASTATLSPVSPSAGLARSGKMLNTSSTMAMSSAAIHKSPSSMLNRPVSPSLKGVSSKPDIKADASNKLAPPMEDDRPSYFRHGRQRSNTVGEAVTFPAVSVTSSPSSPANRRSSMQPDSGSCLKCFEKVVENGVKLPNGDRYHIQCFLCTGCKQIFTESEFHIVNGRPYHPQCSVMAGSTSTMSATTKCAKCLKLVSKRTIRFGGMNYHPQCFTCSHCNQVLQSTSKFFEVDGKVECERCCEEKDRQRLPQMVPLPRSTESSFPTATSPVVRRQSQYGMATNAATSTIDTTRPRMHGSTSPTGEPVGDSSSLQGLDHRPQSPTASSLSPGPMSSTNHMSPMAPRVDPPVLTSLFSTRTRPLPRFGGTVTCPRCKQPIGVMDQTPGPKGEKWHKKCLNCKGCKKVLDSSALTLGEGEAYCRACYNKATKA